MFLTPEHSSQFLRIWLYCCQEGGFPNCSSWKVLKTSCKRTRLAELIKPVTNHVAWSVLHLSRCTSGAADTVSLSVECNDIWGSWSANSWLVRVPSWANNSTHHQNLQLLWASGGNLHNKALWRMHMLQVCPGSHLHGYTGKCIQGHFWSFCQVRLSWQGDWSSIYCCTFVCVDFAKLNIKLLDSRFQFWFQNWPCKERDLFFGCGKMWEES